MQRAEQKTQISNAIIYPIQELRKNDYIKATPETKKSLVKDFSLFSAAEHMVSYGGSAFIGTRCKQSSKSNAKKEYYLTNHWLSKYFATEILVRLGINSPKCRIIHINKNIIKDGMYKNVIQEDIYPAIVSKSIDGYLPMLGVCHGLFLPENTKEKLIKIREKYQIDFEKQVIIDSEKREYKISGNAFGSIIAATLICDFDFSPDGYNFGLTRIGNRFYAAAIDKDLARFEGRNYQELLAIMKRREYLEDPTL